MADAATLDHILDPDAFRTALENAIKGRSANTSPFSVAWASGKLSREHLCRWAENHYHYVGPFADYLAYVYARMPETYVEAKDFLLANMYEEEIGGDRHTDLLIRFGEACGTTRERITDPDNMSPTTRALQSWCYAVAMREDPIVAVAGLVVGLESQVPSIYRRQTPTLRESYGFSDEEVEFFDLHIVLRRDPRRAGLPDRPRARQHARAAEEVPQDLRSRRPDAPALHHRPLQRLRRRTTPLARTRPRRLRSALGSQRCAAATSPSDRRDQTFEIDSQAGAGRSPRHDRCGDRQGRGTRRA